MIYIIFDICISLVSREDLYDVRRGEGLNVK
jgi:hypothetical protein